MYLIKEKWIRELNLSETCKRYRKIVKNRCLYTSYKNKQLRSNNSFAITSTGSYIRIIDFLVDQTHQKEYTICSLVNVENNDSAIKKILHVSETIIAVETKTIESMCTNRSR